MASGPFILVDTAIEAILDGTIDLTGGTFVAVLIAAAHTADPTDDTWAVISGSEASGTGYTSEGQVVSPLTTSRTDGVTHVDADDVTWAAATVSAKYVYIVHRAGGSLASGDLILGYMDLNDGSGNLSSVGADFSVVWSDDGVFGVSRAI